MLDNRLGRSTIFIMAPKEFDGELAEKDGDAVEPRPGAEGSMHPVCTPMPDQSGSAWAVSCATQRGRGTQEP